MNERDLQHEIPQMENFRRTRDIWDSEMVSCQIQYYAKYFKIAQHGSEQVLSKR